MDERLSLGVLTVAAALAIAGCEERETVKRIAPPPAPAAQGPVNPDAGVTAYLCVDGETITAGYPDRETAVVTYKDHAYTLKLSRSADGARYTGYGLQWWTKGRRATIAALKPGEATATAAGLDCTAVPGLPTASSVTRTAYRP